ncbi:NAD(P)/FAD-dependent oxidoreductase [Tsukamurella sp. 8F]|uniref:FAD-dependent oxidoreductase n=1 Tax=unclassified Tsukamurella TaxID=2633480 RepID=UPI0023B90516|nr:MULTISPECIES: NAD(P)/FAD-dependent oxidoreductase [unclassified Tsukamurella]MDF0532477.1 NAD(P)/FAD-dependent oxidoreductase [Tsukamurella sp. 8J]MDF0589322.1 NAD(P)/FAD-dependent oxidoreductase [Tsukamurella sp. 8F]
MTTAAVIGGGIGGLALAGFLDAQGWNVEVFERAPALPATGTALGMWPEAMDVLNRLGAGARVRELGHPQEVAEIRDGAGRALGPRIRAKGATVILSRPRLLETLAEHAPGIEFGSTVGDPGSLDHDVVIGADGIHSATRTVVAGRRIEPRPLAAEVVIGRCPGSTESFTEYWGPDRLFGVTPRDGGFINWYSEFRPEAVADDAPDPDADPVGFLERVYDGWAPRVLDTIGRIDTESVFHYRVREMPRLHRITRGRFALIGDAAHAMTPNLGRGACETLLDAAALAESLGPASTADVPAALARYQRLRMRAAQRTALASHVMFRLALARRGQFPRDLLLRPLGRILG